MGPTLHFLLRHGYAVVFVWVLVEQLGLPVPSIPILLAAGALAGAGRLNLGWTLFLALFACLASDLCWFVAGRRKGAKVLGWLCRISLEPDSCVRRTEQLYLRYGARSLLVAKFIPGLNALASPLAGVVRMNALRFVLFDSAGALIWSGAYVSIGFLLSDQLESVAGYLARLGVRLGVLLAGSLTAFVLYKFIERERFLRSLRVARIHPEELKRLMDSGEHAMVVDLRHSLDFEADPQSIPGALRIDPEDAESLPEKFPRDREIVLYCT
jgi:membrane protein DedA with SNARE-associated domain